jgi:predicted dehydrogenase
MLNHVDSQGEPIFDPSMGAYLPTYMVDAEHPLDTVEITPRRPVRPACPKLRFGVIGYGYWGPQLVRNLSHLAMGSVEYISELSPERRWAAHMECPEAIAVETAAELIGSDVDAVVVATPTQTHYALARAALLRHKHVLVEKPLAASAAQAEELLDLAERQGVTLMVGHTFVYNPAVEMLREVVQSGALGQIYYVDAVRANLGICRSDINVLWDLAPHDLSILGFVFGAMPVRVSAHGAAYVRPHVQDVARLTLEYPNGLLAQIQVSWLSPSKIRRFTVVGKQQMVVFDDVEATEKIRVYNRGIDVPDHTATFGEFQLSYRYGDIVSPHIHWAEPLAVACRHFADAVLEGTPPRSDGRDGLRVVRILEAADASLAADGTFVRVAGAGQAEG